MLASSLSRRLTTIALVLACAPPGLTQAQVIQEHVAGLRAPAKLLALPDGQLLVAEAGNGPNTGRVSMIDRDGRRFTVVDGLPSGLHGPRRDPTGPSGLVLSGRGLYVLIGSGDIALPGAGQGAEIPNPAPSSPLFSSILLLQFVNDSGRLSLNHMLPAAAHARLANGEGVYLGNGTGDTVRISRLADFPDYVAEPRPDEPRNIRISNPYAIIGTDTTLTVVDASYNRIWTVPVTPTLREPVVLTNFAPVPNTTPVGPPVVEAVPASIRSLGSDFVVSLLTGFPFGPGAASLWRVNRDTGATTRIAQGLQTAIDVLPLDSTSGMAYVLEYSRDFLNGGPGRLLQVDTTRGTSLVLAEPFATPTSMARDTHTGDLFVTEFSANRIVRVLVPR